MFRENFKAIGQGVQELPSGNENGGRKKKEEKKKRQKHIGIRFSIGMPNYLHMVILGEKHGF